MIHVSHEDLRVATVCDDDQSVEPGPPYPIARLSCDTHTGLSVDGPCTIPYTPKKYGRVSSNSATDDSTKFVELHKSRMRQYIIEFAHRG
jgi:hypothetical protein